MASENALNLLDDLIKKAKAAGADAADGLAAHSVSISYAQRLGSLERLEREEGQDLGLRVFLGKRQAIVSSTETDPAAMDTLVERAMAMVRAVPEDPHCGLAAPEQLAKAFPSLDLRDENEPSTERLIGLAAACEDAARAVDGHHQFGRRRSELEPGFDRPGHLQRFFRRLRLLAALDLGRRACR